MRTKPLPLSRRTSLLLISCCVLLSVFPTASQAQMTLDGSLGPSGTLSGPNYTIPAEVGQLRGSNLFYSFGVFNIHTGESATFTGPTVVDNILSRVTGGRPSTIDGLLRSEIPGANLFLLNPSGILFGPNASLDVKGSFHASTADALRLADGKIFNAIPGPQDPLLTTAPVAAFGFLNANPAKISIQGSELSVPKASTFSVIGGDIAIGRPSSASSARLRAPGGRMLIASVASAGDVELSTMEQPSALRMEAFTRLGVIEVTQGTFIDVSSEAGTAGTVVIRGEELHLEQAAINANTKNPGHGGVDIDVKQLMLSRGATISSNTNGPGAGGQVTLQAATLTVTGKSRIQSNSLGSGDAGTVRVQATGMVTITEGAEINAATFGAGNAGTIFVAARTLALDGGVLTVDAASSGSTGSAGAISLDVTEALTLSGGARIAGNTQGSGPGGLVVAQAGSVTLREGSSMTSGTKDAGRGGLVQVRTKDPVEGLVELLNGAEISSNTRAQGNAGRVEIQAGELRIDGSGTPAGQFTGIASQAERGSSGNAGTVTVTAEGLVELLNGGQISSATFAQGNAGTSETYGGGQGGGVQVTADIIAISGQDSGLNTMTAGSASGGTIILKTSNLQLTEGAKISAQSTGTGSAGTIRITATDTFLSEDSAITTEAMQTQGGNIQVTAQNMVRLRNSQITTEVAGGDEQAGNITIDPEFVIVEDSQIIAKAVGGPGGNINITADEAVLIDPTSVVDATSEESIDGEINIQAPVTNLSGLVTPLPPDFASAASLLRDRCAARLREGQLSSLIVSGREGLPARPRGVLPSPLFRADREPMGTPKQAEPLAQAVASQPEGDDVPADAMRQGWTSFQRGNFKEAAHYWQEAVRALEREGEVSQQSVALAHLAQAYQKLGHYEQALQSLKSAQAQAGRSGDQILEAFILGELGNVYIPLGPVNQASQYLRDGLRLAKEMRADELVATVLNNLGNLFASQEAFDEAVQAYEESARLAKLTGNHTLTARALTNAALITLRRGKSQDARALVDQALPLLQALSPSHEKAYGLVSIGLIYANLHAHLLGRDASLLQLALRSFNDAVAVAQALGDDRAASYAWGYLGHLYEEEDRYQEALALTHRAVFAAQHVQAPEALYQWQWQSGRVLKALGHSEAAMDVYREALRTLQAIRDETVVAYGEPLRFRETVGPVYAEFADLLLQPGASQEALEEARQLLESLKVAELQNYFEDECVAALRLRETSLDEVSQTAVVIYPVLLPDRTELLVSLPTGKGASTLQRFTVAIGADRMTQAVRAFRQELENRTTRLYLRHAQQLYDWLMRPLEPALASLGATTLVFVPDGALRTIPMAALHDGEQFLIQKYALAITPGLTLTDPRPMPQSARVLAAGLTQAVQGFPPLTYVETELQAIANFYQRDLLLNQEFQVSRLEDALEQGHFPIVHIASHGRFSSDLDDTFILAADGKLTLDRLDQILHPLRFRDEPVELLTLSACQTAAGDDRAALGLAGVAVKAGARSALATLWYINDQASAQLVAEFYRQLRAPSVSRAAALQRAQIRLLGEFNYQHPAYWASFLLINNWL